jgi:hypothetical protein
VTYDCIIVDLGGQRNIRAREIHAYLTRDGVPPAEFLGNADSGW